MEYYIYVLVSVSDGIRYIGSTSNVIERLRKHNNGDSRFTKGHRPWKVIYQEKFSTKGDALRREKFLKTGQGRKYLDERLKINSEIV